MVALQPLVSEFIVVGKLEDFLVDSKGRIEYLYISTPEEYYSITVAKEQTNILSQHLQSGCRLKVTGMRKYKLHQAEVKYKAYRIELLSKQDIHSNTVVKANKSQAKVLICQSSTCWKKGGQAAYEKLQKELRIQGKANEVEVITTGCLKQCKQAPNLIIMPGRHRYSNVQPRQVSDLIAKHLK